MMRCDTTQALLASMAPDLDHPISMAAGQQPPTGTKGHRADVTVLLGPDLEAATRLQIPQSDRLIIATCRQESACWMHGHRPDPVGVASQDAHTLPIADLPHLDQPIVASADELRTLGIENQ